jgi:ferredoxin
VLSALDVFSDDLTTHLFRGSCGRKTRGILPLGPEESEVRLKVDWARCDGHGLCAKIAPEMVQLDSQGYPAFLDMPVPFWLEREAQQAVEMCPAMALSLGSGVGWEPDAPRTGPAIGASQPTGLLLSSSAREKRQSPGGIGQLPGGPRELPGGPRELPGGTRELPGPRR